MSGMPAPGWADLPPPTWHQQRVPGPHAFAVREQHLSSARLRLLTGPWRPALRSHCAPDAAASTASRAQRPWRSRYAPREGRDGRIC